MKITLILLSILPTLMFGQTEKHIIKAPIEEVKLYITAGQMVHRHELDLKEGRNRLVFAGISAYADPQSIQFIMAGDYKLVSVTTEMDYLAAEQVNPRIGKLKDSLEMLEDKLQLNKDQLDSYYAEEAVLNSNRDLGGSNQSLTMDQIKEAADFYRERTLSVKRSISGLRKEQREHNDQIELTRYQLVELNYNENLRSNQIVVLLDVDKNESRSVVLKYLVTDCGWAATYDLSAKDINQKVNLKYKAQVYNNTGNEWKDVKLTLSTGDPRLSASIPDLKTWYLNHYTIQNLKGRKQKYYAPTANDEEYRGMIETNLNSANQRVYDNYYLASEVNQSNLRLDNKFKLQEQMNVGSKAVQMKQIQISELTTEFDIKLKFSCPSDARPYLVDVKEVDLDATFSHISIPKLDRSAFLLAHISGWQDLELIPGPTNVYFGGVYVGVSEIDTRNVSDTLSLSFGRDDKVVVMRKMKKELSSKSVMGGYKKESYSYEIAVRNNRGVPIKMEVYDQIPISRSSDINVIVDELSNGIRDEETGEVVWGMSIPAGDVTGREIGYTLKYPKNAKITVRTFRTISCPSF